MLLLVACACWLKIAFLCEWLCRKLAALSVEGRKYCERKLPSRTDAVAIRGWQSLSRALMRMHCGKMTVKGRDMLNAEGPKLIVANHCHYLDPAVFLLNIKNPVWYMASHLVFKFGHNIVGAFIGRAGAFPVDTGEGRGAAAFRQCVRLLCAGETAVIFPEGNAFFDSQTEPFRSGAVQIARLAEKVSGKKIPIVPVFLDYQGHPGGWIRKFPFAIQCFMVMCTFPLWRRPLKVTVGTPLFASEFAECRDLAAVQLRNCVVQLAQAN
ncbi:MAG: 1-acyl-sn-glycerol-3-phosphate acyltransferase [Candidatus Obscuribacterales bacterium]|nr:1-acyl-sn-glycerol-3-phosphate acyltransferase [Candidatus Obscuribacterales bacterium]